MSNNKELNIGYGEFSLSVIGYDDPFPIVKQVTEFYALLSTTSPNFGTFPVDARQTASPEVEKQTAKTQNAFDHRPAKPSVLKPTPIEDFSEPLQLDESFLAEMREELSEVNANDEGGSVVSFSGGTEQTQHSIMSNYRRLNTAAE